MSVFVFLSNKIPSMLQKEEFSGFTSIDASLGQPQRAPFSIWVIDEGIDIFFRDKWLEKDSFPRQITG